MFIKLVEKQTNKHKHTHNGTEKSKKERKRTKSSLRNDWNFFSHYVSWQCLCLELFNILIFLPMNACVCIAMCICCNTRTRVDFILTIQNLPYDKLACEPFELYRFFFNVHDQSNAVCLLIINLKFDFFTNTYSFYIPILHLIFAAISTILCAEIRTPISKIVKKTNGRTNKWT